MKDTIFREYDIRGKVGTEFLINEAYDLARAIAYYFVQRQPHTKTIAVGMDGRLHSPDFKREICRALLDSGLHVVFVGICPSPALYFALHALPVDGGLMITASHNPKEYNGIKICLGQEGVWGKQVQDIRQLYKEKKYINASAKGTYTEQPIIPSYLDFLFNEFSHLKGMDLSVIVDCGNGAGGTVMPHLIQKMQWPHVKLLYGEVDGTYPHHEADPTIEENMQDLKQAVRQQHADLGVGLDGDCDRMAPVTHTGQLVLGDKLLALFAQPIVQKHPGVAIVFDIKSSSGLIELLKQWGARPYMSATGHTNIKEQMKMHQGLLGGELSCHFFFKDRNFGFDDGIYAMLRLFELIEQSGKALDELLTIFPKKYSSREYRIPCSDERKKAVVDRVTQLFLSRDDAQVITLDGIRATLPYGWGILRSSNTQPVLSMRFEADSPEDLNHIKSVFIAALTPDIDESVLRNYMSGD
ncbi:MAG TPA: phosphomannomutase/phosphoglucomutase [Candidatus Dependentiae bacterium]|nr:phosphomannomutase/phosphoglucomutase [Candidatus Dependentiae bacterium]HRQ62332.1 phosphomannomutase/phosphoglucomutase [Candidatus Dependentiae bacterium]